MHDIFYADDENFHYNENQFLLPTYNFFSIIFCAFTIEKNPYSKSHNFIFSLTFFNYHFQIFQQILDVFMLLFSDDSTRIILQIQS